MVGGLQWSPCWKEQPVDSSPMLSLYLWVTWLLRRPGNVCSVSMLNEPPSKAAERDHHFTSESEFVVKYDSCRDFSLSDEICM